MPLLWITKVKRDRVAAEIRQKGIRRREFERFITTLEKLPEEVTAFEESMWSNLVDYITVSAKDDLQFTLACGGGNAGVSKKIGKIYFKIGVEV